MLPRDHVSAKTADFSTSNEGAKQVVTNNLPGSQSGLSERVLDAQNSSSEDSETTTDHHRGSDSVETTGLANKEGA